MAIFYNTRDIYRDYGEVNYAEENILDLVKKLSKLQMVN
jgi:hypothetical protein